MAGGITYADLQFARSPLEKSQGEEPNEGELTYENLQVSSWVLEKEVAECGPLKSVPELPCWATSCPCWRPVTNCPMLGVLALCLFLLATNIALGVEYLQASRQLQEASREHAAKSHVLGESIHRLQAGLEESRRLLRQSEQELNSTTVALWQSRAAENRTRRQLQHQELQANDSLALLRREQERLETNLSQATSCRQIGCCPRGWALFRWKCLWASSAWRTWEQSKADCERMSSRLLVLPEPWSAAELWKAVGETFSQRFSFLNSERFWVGLVKNREQDWTWKWVDGSLYKGETLYGPFYTSYGALGNGQLLSPSGKNRFICERAASPEDPALSDRLWRDL